MQPCQSAASGEMPIGNALFVVVVVVVVVALTTMING
jgi:hypothetical protein